MSMNIKIIGSLLGVVLLFAFVTEPLFGAHEKELETFSKEKFEAADVNNDGFVDEEEYIEYVSKQRDKVDAPDTEQGKTAGSEESKGVGMEVMEEAKKDEGQPFKTFLDGRIRFFRELDEDNDRRLSFDEVRESKGGFPF